ncbi:hypothetical protein JOE21_002034 [Desmospora profundinema]|uniref:Uncharacterized protein n=1 Tax=Desmospora profundinema TaxID=1571184 RepID=A0ABU1IMR4_9BACL|nr:hypothetical protein [Desmospora profundinema]
MAGGEPLPFFATKRRQPSRPGLALQMISPTFRKTGLGSVVVPSSCNKAFVSSFNAPPGRFLYRS